MNIFEVNVDQDGSVSHFRSAGLPDVNLSARASLRVNGFYIIPSLEYSLLLDIDFNLRGSKAGVNIAIDAQRVIKSHIRDQKIESILS